MAEVTLGDLLAWEPRLRLASGFDRADDEGRVDQDPGSASERELTWVVTARATAPMLPPLRGGELILLPHRILSESGVALGPLLRELAAHEAAGVVLESEAVPPRLGAAGAPLPLLVLPVGPVAPDLEGDLNRLLTQKRGELYRAGTDLGRLLAGLTTAGAALRQILAATADVLNVTVEVVDAKGFPLERAGSEADLLVAPGESQPMVILPLAGGEVLRLGPVTPERQALARLAGERVVVAAEAALARAVQLRPRGPERVRALAEFLTAPDGTRAADLGARAAALGLAADATYRVALAAPVLGAPELQRLLALHGPVHDAGQLDAALAAVVEVRGERSTYASGFRDPWRSLRSVRGAGRTAAGPASSATWVAVSGPARGASGLPAATRQARYVAGLLAAGLLRGPTARFDEAADIGAFRLLYGYWGSADLAAFTAEALAELPARDRRGMLRRTLLTYLQTGGSHVEAAARLGIHRNTLAYRLKQIAALTGHDPADPSTWLLLHLALLAGELPPVPE